MMKKMIKKSVAALIAVLMVISIMPFTAVTASAADSTEAQYVKANIANFNGYTGTAGYNYNGTNLASADSSYYSNLLYDDGKFNDKTQQGSDNSVYAKIYINDNVVMLYDGKNDTILPVVVRTWKTSSNSGTGQKYLHEISMEDANSLKSWQLKQDWTGGKGDSLGWPTGTTSVYYNQFVMGTSVYYDGKNTGYVWKNKLYYNGPQNSSDGYEKLNSNITMIVHHTQWGINEKERKLTLSNTTANIYVVNYKPIADKISAMKSVYNTIQQNGESAYCADYLDNFYKAAYQVMTLNPNNYSYSSGVEAAVQSAADAIKNVVNNYLTTATTEPAKHTETTKTEHKDATCTEDGFDKRVTTCSHCGEVISESTSPIEKLGHNYVITSHDDTTHTYTCTRCQDTYSENHTYAEGSNVCTKCGYTRLDKTAYNKAVDEAMLIFANADGKYTSESVKAYKAVVDAAMDEGDAADTQAKIDVATSKILSAKSLLAKANVTITFIVQNDDTDTDTKETKTVAWGETVELDSHSSKVSKWTVDVNGTTSVAANAESVYSHVATEDATIIAYVSNEESETVQYSKVVFYGKNNAIVGIVYVPADGTPVTTSSLFTAPEVPFYNFLGWDKADITADGSEISVKASYAPKSETEDKCGIWLNGQFVKSYSYDSYVYLFDADKSKKYAMYSDAACENLITYFDGVDFNSPHIDNLYIKEVNEADRKATVGFTGSFIETTDTTKTSAFNVKFWLPEGATLIETGVDWKATMPSGKVASGRDRATKFSARNEYTYKGKFGNAQKSIEFTPYVTYTVGGNKTTVYGTSQTVEY